MCSIADLSKNIFIFFSWLILASIPCGAAYDPLKNYGHLEYKIQLDDQITLYCHYQGEKIFSFNKLSILPNGKITLPFWGEVPIRGMTTAEFKEFLKQNQPETISEVKDYEIIVHHSQSKIPVIGEVRNPGYYLLADSTVYDMIGAAGGFSFYADRSAVKVIKQHKDGTREDFFVNFPKEVYNAYEKGSGVGQEKYIVNEGDIIYVRRSKWRSFLGVMRFVLQAATLGVVSGFTAAAVN